jgi:putative ABC transport system permease protein
VTFLGLVVRNLLRRRVRAMLTLVGITLGIATVVALGVITSGLKSTASAFVRSGGADFLVGQQGAADLSFSTIPEATVGRMKAVDGVDAVRASLLHIFVQGSNPFFFLSGVRLDELRVHPPQLVAGTLPTADDEVVLGVDAAGDLGAEVGDMVNLTGRGFRVVGIYRSEVTWENGGAYASLATVQAVAGKAGMVSVVSVWVDADFDPADVARRVEAEVSGVVTISSSSEYGKVDQGFVILDAVNVAISGLAVVLGGVGVMNTMVMSINERTREIGVFRAVGWTGRRVLAMIVLESLLLCVLAGALGSLVGVGIARLAVQMPAVKGFIELSLAPWTFAKAMIVGVSVGLAGALYPAIRSSRLLPIDALRYE